MIEHQVLYKVYEAIYKSKYGKHLRLTGAFSMVFNIGIDRMRKEGVMRLTRDLDFEVNKTLTSIDFKYLEEEMNKNLDPLECETKREKVTKSGNKGLVYEVREKRTGKIVTRFTIDFSIDGYDSLGKPVMALEEFLGKKIALKSKIYDRRFKDLVDVIIIIKIAYPKGITKGQILKCIELGGEPLNQNNAWVRREVIEDNIEQSRKFKPKNVILGYSNEELVGIYTGLIRGVYLEEVDEGKIFREGRWT